MVDTVGGFHTQSQSNAFIIERTVFHVETQISRKEAGGGGVLREPAERDGADRAALCERGAVIPGNKKAPVTCQWRVTRGALELFIAVMSFAGLDFDKIVGDFVNKPIRVINAAAVCVLSAAQLFRLSFACHGAVTFNAFQQAVDFA